MSAIVSVAIVDTSAGISSGDIYVNLYVGPIHVGPSVDAVADLFRFHWWGLFVVE